LRRTSAETIGDQIRKIILHDTSAGTFAPGEQLPTERELADRFGVSLAPLRSALTDLTKAGQSRPNPRCRNRRAEHSVKQQSGEQPAVASFQSPQKWYGYRQPLPLVDPSGLVRAAAGMQPAAARSSLEASPGEASLGGANRRPPAEQPIRAVSNQGRNTPVTLHRP
jgi:DNA-binding transcriptional MocR family regulator